MRLKTFMCTSIEQGLNQIRRELGAEAIIVSTHKEGNFIKITAACDQPQQSITDTELKKQKFINTPQYSYDYLIHLCKFHGVPYEIQESLTTALVKLPASVLSKKLDHIMEKFISVKPYNKTSLSPVTLLTGTSGVGKSVTLAKLAIEYVIAGKDVQLVTCDSFKAGAIEQLQKLAGALNIPVNVIHSLNGLQQLIQKSNPSCYYLIDTPGMNPFNTSDRQLMSEFIQCVRQFPTLIMAGGQDAYETREQLLAFRELGVVKMLITRLDTTRRLGSILTALLTSKIELVGLSDGPTLGDRLIFPSIADFTAMICKKAPEMNFLNPKAANSQYMASSTSYQKPQWPKVSKGN